MKLRGFFFSKVGKLTKNIIKNEIKTAKMERINKELLFISKVIPKKAAISDFHCFESDKSHRFVLKERNE